MKPTVVKTLNKYQMSHASVGDLSSLLIDCIKGTEFLLHYYGQRKTKNLSEAQREYKKLMCQNATPELQRCNLFHQ